VSVKELEPSDCAPAPALAPASTRAPASARAPSRPGQHGVTFAEVFAAHAGYVLGLLGRLGVASADVEDVAQDVFVVIHQKLPEFAGRSSLKTWVCGICLRKASDYRRRAHRRRERLAADPAERERAAGDPEDATLQREDVQLLQAALAALPEPLLQVFVLYELEELPMADVARAVGCPRFTGYTRLRAARQAIRAFLAQQPARRSR
jgi:RNA polymerase sigma-70 factor (ECF subfamily)